MQHHLQHTATDCTTTFSRSMISLNDGWVVAQSTTSTFHGKADAEKSSDKSALIFKGSGWSVMTARSRSEWGFATGVY